MANGGFMAGGFAQGLTSGLQAGTAALAPGRDLALRQAEREAKTAEQRRTELIGQIKELDTGFAKVVGERGPEAGQRLLDSLRAPSITIGDQKLSQLDLFAMRAQQAGVEMVTPEILESRLASHLAGGLTAEEAGRRAGMQKVAEAETITGQPLTPGSTEAQQVAGMTPMDRFEQLPPAEKDRLGIPRRSFAQINQRTGQIHVSDMGQNVVLRTFRMSDGTFTTARADDQGTIDNLIAQGGVETNVTFQPQNEAGLAAMGGVAGQRAFIDATTETINLVGQFARMREQLGTEETLTGFPAAAARSINNIVVSTQQTARLAGFDDTALLDPAQYDLGKISDEARKSQGFVTNILGLAYTLARQAEPGGRLSDRDVQIQIDRLAGGQADPKVVLQALAEAERGALRNFKNRWQVMRQMGATVGPFPLELEPDLTPEAVRDAVASGQIDENEGARILTTRFPDRFRSPKGKTR